MRNFIFFMFLFSWALSAAAADEGVLDDPKSGIILDLMSTGKWREALREIEKIEKKEKREYWIGAWHHGKGNGEYNPIEAIRHYEVAASSGIYEAKLALMFLYLSSGDIRIINHQKGQEYAREVLAYLRDHEKFGRPDILSNLGLFYAWGLCVDKDLAKAFEYYKRAVKLGSNNGIVNYETLRKVFEIEGQRP